MTEHIFLARLSGGTPMRQHSSEVSGPNYTRTTIGAPQVQIIQKYCSVSDQGASKATGIENRGKFSDFFTPPHPVNITGRMGDTSESIEQVQPRTKTLILLPGRRCAG